VSVGQFLRRMGRAVRLESQLYEEVEAEHASIRQATLVVLLACLAGGAGTWVRDAVLGGGTVAQVAARVTLDLVEPLVFWLVGSALAYMVGATFFRGPDTQTDYREVLRTTGFAFTPGLLRGLAFVPPPALGFGLTVFGDLWMLACAIVAVRQALDFTTLRALGTFGAAYAILWLVLQGLVGLPL
jgi:hypothetical protein